MLIPNIYNQNLGQLWQDNLPVDKRLPKFIAWGAWLLTPLQWLRDLIFGDYYAGSTAALWAGSTTYAYGNRVCYVDNAIYECINPAGITSSTPPNQDTTNWMKVLDTFVGLYERSLYTGQKTMLEFALNRYFKVTTLSLAFFSSAKWYNNIAYAPGQNVYYTDGKLYTCILANTNELPTNATYWVLNPAIYIVREAVVTGEFWMATTNTGSPNSYMPIDSSYATSWMPIIPSTQQLDSFIIYVPAALALTINANIIAATPNTSDTYKTLITSIVSKYVRAARQFNVLTY